MECWGFPDTLLQYPITPSLQIPVVSYFELKRRLWGVFFQRRTLTDGCALFLLIALLVVFSPAFGAGWVINTSSASIITPDVAKFSSARFGFSNSAFIADFPPEDYYYFPSLNPLQVFHGDITPNQQFASVFPLALV
jgi:hypothetical protein